MPPRPKFDDLTTEEIRSIDSVFPPAMRVQMFRAFTQRGMEFFDLYLEFRRYEAGATVDADLTEKFRQAANQLIRVVSPVDQRTLSPAVVSMLADIRPQMHNLLSNVQRGHQQDSFLWQKVNTLLVPLLKEILRDKGIYAIDRRLPGQERWVIFRKMTDRQEEIERLRDKDPESYQILVEQQRSISVIEKNIARKIEKAGQVLSRKFVRGRPVLTGTDPLTGETFYYDRNGDVDTREAYTEKLQVRDDMLQNMSGIATKTIVDISELRRMSAEQVDAISSPISYESMTDDKVKQGALTRIYPVKKVPVRTSGGADGQGGGLSYHKIVASGRYKGCYLDDLVNIHGRLVEGTAYGFDPKSSQAYKIPQRIDPAQREPYVSVTETDVVIEGEKQKQSRLMIKIPGTHQYSDVRQAMRAISCNGGGKRGCIPSVEFSATPGSRSVSFYFEPKDFGAVREAVKSLSFSSAAIKLLQQYFADLARSEQATETKNLTPFSADALGGFKAVLKNPTTGELRKPDLKIKQKQALAWMDSKGDQGVCALDTGGGKTSVFISAFQKMVRDGTSEADNSYTAPGGRTVQHNGRFLVVVPKGLKGNVTREVRKFLQDPKALLDRTDIVTYQEFASSGKSGKIPGSLRSADYWQGKARWELEQYNAIAFDEAAELTSTSSGKFKVANALHHPHKILLTASPIEREPVQAYLLACIANNTRLVGDDPTATKNRLSMRRFMDRFTDRVGGRVVGVKDDPSTKRDLHVWVKQNVFYADKTEYEDVVLPDLKDEVLGIEMEPAQQAMYQEVSRHFGAMLKGMTAKFRDRSTGAIARDPAVEASFSRAFAPVLLILDNLQSRPQQAWRDLQYMQAHRTYPDGRPLPKSLEPMLRRLKIQALPMPEGNPKLEQASRIVLEKIEAGESNRAILFSDNAALCRETAQDLSLRVPGKHAVADSKSIQLFEAGQELTEVRFPMQWENVLRCFIGDEVQARKAWVATGGVSHIKLPLKAGVYRRHPEIPAHDIYNPHYRADRWQTFGLQEVIAGDPWVKTATLDGKVYSHGHNLQAFNTVIHLDRDSWSSETMKQRTARAWRQGQVQTVSEYTLDCTYGADADPTLDQIRGFHQTMESDLFDSIIKEAQKINLGREWLEIRQRVSSHVRLDHKLADLWASPYSDKPRTPRGW